MISKALPLILAVLVVTSLFVPAVAGFYYVDKSSQIPQSDNFIDKMIDALAEAIDNAFSWKTVFGPIPDDAIANVRKTLETFRSGMAIDEFFLHMVFGPMPEETVANVRKILETFRSQPVLDPMDGPYI